MRAVVLAALLCLHVDCILVRSVWPDFTLSIPFCTLPMPVPCQLPCAVHFVRCTPLRDVCFPVLWFLQPVPCVMYILRARLFFPL